VSGILVIEPDPVARQLLADFVAGLGHDVVDEPAAGATPDLVLIEPADEAALAAAQALREREAGVPIVCVSSEHPNEQIEELQPSAYLMKPFRNRLLEWAIAEALAGAPAYVAA
jgi:DNA-binding response OmpR family regulator